MALVKWPAINCCYYSDCCNCKVPCNLLSVITRTTTSYTSKFLNLPKCKVICLPATHICYTSVSPSTPFSLRPALLLPRMPVLSIYILYNPHEVEYVYVSISAHTYICFNNLAFFWRSVVVFPSVCCLKLIKTDPGRQRPAASSLNTRTHMIEYATLCVCGCGRVLTRVCECVNVCVVCVSVCFCIFDFDR